jgi:uncharacterized membrane-anchored protein
MRNIILYIYCLLCVTAQVAVAEETKLTPEQEKNLIWAKNLWQSLDRQHGEIKLPNGVATLKVPEQFYYLNPVDAEKVLVEVWHNPPTPKRLGMLFPAGSTPFDEAAWAVTIDYEEDGYVADKDADQIDYKELLSQMQEDTSAASKERVKQGYESIELVGWAANPFYDKKSNKLHWAKEIKFGDQKLNTLNYSIRVLGRKGVLVLNFIAGIDQLKLIEARLNEVLAIAEFNDGFKYDEFNPSLDKVAAYGIGALVAGKVIAKTGILITLLLFLKKFGIFILVGATALAGKFFRRNKS